TPLAKARGSLIEPTQLVHQESEPNQAESIRIGWHVDLVGTEDGALSRPKQIRRAVEKDVIVFIFDLGQLLAKDEVMGVSRIRAVLLLKIDQVEIRRDQVQIRKQLLALF